MKMEKEQQIYTNRREAYPIYCHSIRCKRHDMQNSVVCAKCSYEEVKRIKNQRDLLKEGMNRIYTSQTQWDLSNRIAKDCLDKLKELK